MKNNSLRYWRNRPVDPNSACPNPSLFRFINVVFGKLQNKRALEVGFGHGADLLECGRRGASIVGLDVNPTAVETLTTLFDADVKVFNAGVDSIKADQPFDLIYSRDTICYLTEQELLHFFSDCQNALSANGVLIVQFIQNDFKNTSSKKTGKEDFRTEMFNEFVPSNIHSKDNPISFLKPSEVIKHACKGGLKLIGQKTKIESYDADETLFRVDKYLAFKVDTTQNKKRQ